MKRGTKLSVRERVDAVLTLHRAEHPAVPIAISELADRAGVSRANLYERHSDLIKTLQPLRRSRKTEQSIMEVPTTALREEIKELKRQNKALLYLNVELREEIYRLQSRVNRPVPGRSRTASRSKKL